jgi:hypothetical protein
MKSRGKRRRRRRNAWIFGSLLVILSARNVFKPSSQRDGGNWTQQSLAQQQQQQQQQHPIDEIIRETTRLLYKDSPHQSQWIDAPLPKIYIYNTLPANLSDIETVANCVERRFLSHHNYTGCGWQPHICDKVHHSHDVNQTNTTPRFIALFENYKSNYAADTAYLQWFQRYPYQTTDPEQADLFVVPYLHKSVCLCHTDISTTSRVSARCPFTPRDFSKQVLHRLPYYHKYRPRHLFLLLEDYTHNSGLLKSLAMSLTLGPIIGCRGKLSHTNQSCGHVTSPYINYNSELQPPLLQHHRTVEWWVERNRTYSVGALMNAPRWLKMRHQIAQNVSAFIPPALGGLPTNVTFSLHGRPTPSTTTTFELYRESILCPILSGDDAVQKRFFDVILQGCIPLVPYFPKSIEGDAYPTFFQWNGRPSIRQTYPWSKGTFRGDAQAGINYLDMVVPFDGFTPESSLQNVVRATLANTTYLRELRRTSMTFAPLFQFGLEDNLQQFVDGFAATFVAIRHYLYTLDDRPSPVQLTQF